MGLFGPSDEELAKREIAAKMKYVASHTGQKIDVDIDELAYEDERFSLERKKFMYRIVYSLSFIFLTAIILIYFFGVPFSDKGIVLSEFNQIKNGMSYMEVVRIIGEEGTLLSDVDLSIGPEYATQMYSWNGSGISNANVTFQGGKVIMKAQFGLH